MDSREKLIKSFENFGVEKEAIKDIWKNLYKPEYKCEYIKGDIIIKITTLKKNCSVDNIYADDIINGVSIEFEGGYFSETTMNTIITDIKYAVERRKPFKFRFIEGQTVIFIKLEV